MVCYSVLILELTLNARESVPFCGELPLYDRFKIEAFSIVFNFFDEVDNWGIEDTDGMLFFLYFYDDRYEVLLVYKVIVW